MSQLLTTDRLKENFGGGLPKERGRWEEVKFPSGALGRDAGYVAWLPPDYDGPGSEAARYPVLYLLHGVGGGGASGRPGYEEWRGYALAENMERLLARGLIQPMIVVLPDGGQGYWMNHASGGPRWGDLVAGDVVADVDKRFRTQTVRERRAIGGLSMGAHGALQLALNHPGIFGVAGAHSPTLRTFDERPPFFGDREWFARHDPLSLVQRTDNARRLITWIDVGHNDSWRGRAEALRAVYHTRGAPLEFHVLEGDHQGWYWMAYLPEYLRFYSAALRAGGK